ncbi:Isonitrile hydratase-like protein xanA [Fulvia fulva]|nr:Isonitrile hydratase-like protein xanA [Fulvia fulva]
MVPSKVRVLGLMFPSFNVLDLTGPCEVFGSNFLPGERSIDIASATESCTSSEGVTVQCTFSFDELLNDTSALSDYDILLVPGARDDYIDAALKDDKGLLQIIKTFATLENDGKERWLFSVCTGAAFLAHVGVLSGKTATTHWTYLDKLKETCKGAGEEADIVRKRFVDAGRSKTGVRVVTAGGVSCGMDAALWIASVVYDLEQAKGIAKGMDYAWAYAPNDDVTEGWTV